MGSPGRRGLALALCLALGPRFGTGQCHNNCNKQGLCAVGKFGAISTCECFSGYQGPDCALRSCRSAPAWADVPNGTDTAHDTALCSNRGYCDHVVGYCVCEIGFEGFACERLSCPNDCSGRGECLSVKEAAAKYDGFHLNRSSHRYSEGETRYDLWDATMLRGCVCDPGYSSFDCSVIDCDSGDDRRTTGQKDEKVTLFCDCDAPCNGTLTVSFMGGETTVLEPSSTSKDLVTALGLLRELHGSKGVLYPVAIGATTSPLGAPLCSSGGSTTRVEFFRDAGDLPVFWLQEELSTPRKNVHMITNQTLICDCTECSGKWSLEFDGQSSPVLNHDATSADVETALNTLSNIKPGDMHVVAGDGGDEFCASGKPFYVVFEMPAGNQPALRAISSFYQRGVRGGTVSVVTDDGSKEYAVCNDAGYCDDASEVQLPDVLNGTCYCDQSWESDGDVGSCGAPKFNTSAWTGLQRCDGNVLPTSGREEVEILNDRFFYVMDSLNLTTAAFTRGSGVNSTSRFIGDAGAYKIGPVDPGEKRLTLSEFQFNMTNGTTAGCALDLSYRKLYYIDHKIKGVQRRSFANISQTEVVLEGLSNTLNDIALNLLFGERSAYVSDPGVRGKLDGQLYSFSLETDVDLPYAANRVTNLTEVVLAQGVRLGDPMGLALDLRARKLYWSESGNESVADGKVYRCDLDGGNVVLVVQHDLVDPRGIVLDLRNFTIFIADAGAHAIFKADMGYELDVVPQVELAYYRNRTWFQKIVSVYETDEDGPLPLEEPWAITIDTTNDFLYWTDRARGAIFRSDLNGSFGELRITSFFELSDPTGLALDNGLGPLLSLTTVDCYGHGVCGGPAGNFKCTCYDGFFGNCNMTQCPSGPAWFDQPSATNVAHAPAICSNAGYCDHASGLCDCHQGFEGGACERLSCPKGGTDEPCSGHGECLTLRQLGLRRTSNGDAAPVRYGTPMAGNATAWDADHVQGCLCEAEGYFNGTQNNGTAWGGFDCSRKMCPTGDVAFMQTNGTQKVFESQLLFCFAESGNFTLTFRTATTKGIPFDASLKVLEEKLLALETIGTVSVRTEGNASTHAVCNNRSGSLTNITFTSELGDLPMLTADARFLGGATEDSPAAVTVTEASKGTKDDLECSMHGYCDAETGSCDCFSAYFSSDADAKSGLRGDCGFVDVASSFPGRLV
ncbi:hypothetical protein M885DRAFT_517875 [Pelagophyceae sp. CCMP2097]|nr:hypothetical protein M885DRAFT_517875 [Pelagophyceae sp. CCMP2097]